MFSIRGRAASLPLRQTQNGKNRSTIATKRPASEKSQKTGSPSFFRAEADGPLSWQSATSKEVRMKSMITTAALTGVLAISIVTDAFA